MSERKTALTIEFRISAQEYDVLSDVWLHLVDEMEDPTLEIPMGAAHVEYLHRLTDKGRLEEIATDTFNYTILEERWKTIYSILSLMTTHELYVLLGEFSKCATLAGPKIVK